MTDVTSKFEMVDGVRRLKSDMYRAARIRELREEAMRAGMPSNVPAINLGPQVAPRLLLPPGIGDVHWVLQKMRAYSRVYLGGQRPDVWLVGAGDRDRAADLMERCPLVRYRGTYPLSPYDAVYRAAFLYGEQPRQVYGFDQLVSANVHLEQNGDFATWMPECEIEWDYPIEERDGDAALAEEKLKAGPYVMASFFNGHWYGSHFLPQFPVSRIAHMLQVISKRCRVLLTGAHWDLGFLSEISIASGVSIELVGQTTTAQLLSLLRRCAGFVGHPAGNGIMAAHFRRPTALLWSSNWFHRPLFDSWVRPEDRGTLYCAIDLMSEDPVSLLENWP